MQKNQKRSASSSPTSSVEIEGIDYNYISLNGSAFEVDVPDSFPPALFDSRASTCYWRTSSRGKDCLPSKGYPILRY